MDKKLRVNFIFNFITQVVTVLTPLIIAPYISRVFNVEIIGIYNYCYSLVSIFGMFANMGISVYGIPAIAKYKDNPEEKIKAYLELLFIKLIFGIIISILYLLFVIFIFEQTYQTYYILFGLHILSVFFDITWLYQAFENFKVICIRTLIIKLVSLIAIFLFVKDVNDFNIYITIMMLANLLPNIILFIMSFSEVKFEKFSLKKLNLKKHISPIFILFFPALAYTLSSMIDKAMIKIITNGTSEVGYYEQAYKIAFIGVTVISVFATVLASRISATKDDEKIKDIHKYSYSIVSIISIPMFIGLFLLSDYFIPFYYGPGYENSIMILKLFSLLPFIIGISNFVSYQYFIPKLITKPSFIILLCSLIINLSLNMIFINFWGGFGAALATIISESFISIMYLIFYSKYQKISVVFNCVYKYFISGFLTFIIFNFIMSIVPCNSFIIFILYVLGILLSFILVLLILKDNMVLNAWNFIKKKIRRSNNA